MTAVLEVKALIMKHLYSMGGEDAKCYDTVC